MQTNSKAELNINIPKIAEKIRSQGLKDPACFLFESHLPAFNILYSIFLCTEPFVLPFISTNFRSTLHALYQNPELKELLIEELRK